MVVKTAPETAPRIDEEVAERLRRTPGAWDLVVDLWYVTRKPTAEQREAQFEYRIAPRLSALVEARDDLRHRLDVGADDLGDLGDDVPESPRERTWFRWLEEYKTICDVLAVADEVKLGKAIVWEERDDD